MSPLRMVVALPRTHSPAKRYGRGQRRKIHVKAEKRPGCNSLTISRQAVSAARRVASAQRIGQTPAFRWAGVPSLAPEGATPAKPGDPNSAAGRTTTGRHSPYRDSPTDTEHVLYNNIGQVILRHNSPPVGEYQSGTTRKHRSVARRQRGVRSIAETRHAQYCTCFC